MILTPAFQSCQFYPSVPQATFLHSGGFLIFTKITECPLGLEATTMRLPQLCCLDEVNTIRLPQILLNN